ncbi:kinase-like domain-containing protein [Stachybotrys elegans]|uniref:non-specific serine/threonine protein kinase n=1 Tax=Stachybotrys elegans TaxID=80388 RepID=A0A8K0SVH2_9HYPO|nr:kinase-like domain-containing protein [Stachybotrys elegans]
MDNADLIARLYPASFAASELIKNHPRFQRVPLRYVPKEQHSSRRTRGGTEPPTPDNTPISQYAPHLDLTFRDVPRTSYGVVFGCDPRCDVVLPDMPGISAHHFSVTFDDANRLIIRDLGSMVGTQVTYDDEGTGRRSNFQWILSDRRVKQSQIAIQVHKLLSFLLVLGDHDIESPAYISKVERFRRGSGLAEDLFNDLNFSLNPATRRPTGSHTPCHGELYLRKQLGKGAYGVVTHLWNVSDGLEYALKEPSAVAIRDGRVKRELWKKEASILSRLSHPHIVKLLRAEFDPYPQLYLEYAPCGSLQSLGKVTGSESAAILSQCLSALNYMHSHKPPIVHRDIKPANILVYYRDAYAILVKFGDFGLAQDDSRLKTLCGTTVYLAPELFAEREDVHYDRTHQPSYTEFVDIWSLGVVVYELFCRLPEFHEHYLFSIMWPQRIWKEFRLDYKKAPNLLKRFLLQYMLRMDVRERSPADRCHHELNKIIANISEPQPGSKQYPQSQVQALKQKYKVPTLRRPPAGPASKRAVGRPVPASASQQVRQSDERMDLAYILEAGSSPISPTSPYSGQHANRYTNGGNPLLTPPLSGSIHQGYGTDEQQRQGYPAQAGKFPRRKLGGQGEVLADGIMLHVLNQGVK